jgi:hypothetical protein
MSSKTKGDSVRQKLITLSKKLGVKYSDLETVFLIERLVARLVASKKLADRLVFKGGFVGLKVYKSHRYTVDLDALLVKSNIKQTLEQVRIQTELNLDDGVWFCFETQVDLQWAPYAQTSTGTQLKKALGKGLKEATEDATEQALGPGAGVALKNINERLGTLLSTRKKELGEVGKEEMKNLFTSVDAIGLGALGASGGNPWWMALKKAADIAKLQGPRSTAGKLMYRFGDSVVAPKAVERSAWSLLNREEK